MLTREFLTVPQISDIITEKDVNEMSTLERWIMFLVNSSDQGKREMVNQILKSEEGISMAAETLLTISKDENERARLLNEYRIILDYQSGLSAAEKKGLQIGEQRGVLKGEQRGKQLGKIESAVNIIKSLNVTVTEAMNVLQLAAESRDEIIAELKKQNITFTE